MRDKKMNNSEYELEFKPVVLLLGKLPPPYYGPAIATEIILNSNLQNDFKLVHVSTKLNPQINSMGKFTTGKIKRLIKIYIDYVKKIRGENVDLILIPISQSTSGLLKDYPFFVIGKIYKKKIVVQLRGSKLLDWYQGRGFILKKMFSQMFSSIDGAIVLGKNLTFIFEPFIAKNKIFIVPNGANYHFPEKNCMNKIRILYLSNLIKAKGIDIFLNSLLILPQSVKNKIIINIAGEWTDNLFKKKCMDIINNCDLNYQFYGTVNGKEKLHLLKNSDIFVFPPRMPEGHPWVIVEAMAAGLPIITTDQGAIKECVENEKNGFIVENESPTDLSEKLNKLITDDQLRNRMSNKSYYMHKEHFSEEAMINNIKNVFNEVLIDL